MAKRVEELLREHGIQASPQRLAVGEAVLFTDTHPTAEEVSARARAELAWLSRATVYNTLNLFVRKGLLRTLQLGEGPVVYDPKTSAHHHFIDERSGRIHDVPWEALKVDAVGDLKGLRISEVQVILRGEVASKK
jgi:Fur family transcriptional regulator, iron response regulator